MKNYLLDTNIVLYSIRANETWKLKSSLLGLEQSTNFISVITFGELWSLSLQNNWGTRRISEMEKLLPEFIVIDINIKDIILR